MKITGIGIDICKIARIEKILSKPYRSRFINRVLHPSELHANLSPQFLASRWASKEALVKATNSKSLPFSQILISSDESGKPFFSFNSDVFRGYSFFLSISHEEDISVAVVISTK